MVEPLEEQPEGCLAADDLLLLDFPSDLDLNPTPYRRNRNSPLPTVAGGLQDQSLLDILDSTDIPAVDGFPGLTAEEGGGGDEEEEELEWLSNKDAFPALETSFEIPTHSRSSSGGGTGSSVSAAAAAMAEGARSSPVSVLAVVAPSKVPVRPRSKGKRRRRGVLVGLSPAVAAREAKERRRCRHCEAEETPQWRAGPDGPKTLCNACGVRYKSGRLVPEYRPAASPTFSADKHSNSHRRIMEMRRRNSTRGRRTGRQPAMAFVAGSAL